MRETAEFARDYFQRQFASNQEYWRRFAVMPDCKGKRVLDLGCGHGALSVDIAQAGGEVTGIDLDAERIAFANENVATRFPALADRLEFRCIDVAQLPERGVYDVIVSKDTFEHVVDLPAVLLALHGLLRPGGTLYAGFSPLYYSPRGDHGEMGLRVPWAHSLLPDRLVFASASRVQGRPVGSVEDVGLNGRTPQQFLAAFEASPFQVVDIGYNRGDKRLVRLLDRARSVPVLERFVTVSMYATLRAAAGPVQAAAS